MQDKQRKLAPTSHCFQKKKFIRSLELFVLFPVYVLSRICIRNDKSNRIDEGLPVFFFFCIVVLAPTCVHLFYFFYIFYFCPMYKEKEIPQNCVDDL